MVDPVQTSSACTYGVLEAVVEPIHHAIALWMEGGGLHVLDVEKKR